jgi:hypothetical protein
MPHEISQECGRVYTLMVARTLESKGLSAADKRLQLDAWLLWE